MIEKIYVAVEVSVDIDERAISRLSANAKRSSYASELRQDPDFIKNEKLNLLVDSAVDSMVDFACRFGRSKQDDMKIVQVEVLEVEYNLPDLRIKLKD